MISKEIAQMIVDGIKKKKFVDFDKKSRNGWYSGDGMIFEGDLKDKGTITIHWNPKPRDYSQCNLYIDHPEVWAECFNYLKGAEIEDGYLSFTYQLASGKTNVSGHISLRID